MYTAFWAVFSVLILAEILEDARLAKRVKTLINCVSIPVKTTAKVTLQEAVKILLSDFTDKFVLLINRIKFSLLGIYLFLLLTTLIHLLRQLLLVKDIIFISVSLGI